MNDIYLIIFVTGICAYVVAPLFKKHRVAMGRDKKTSSLVGELLHQQQMAADSGLVCPKCRFPVKPGDKFCAECGAKLVS
ncbi:zinc-ribbon domain-containing protein [candidate division KSB1 bacterium]|nr:zinc-ribbon domain-containing protein [candidate division KSB1 bacterium]RQW03215.1 MAG: zinc-ribbon domain-containing protein [candidate division KSB1 bacterium]